MTYLLDVNFLLACAWSGHADHVPANQWLNSVGAFATAPLTEMGFLRVSMSPAYDASFSDARTALAAILRLKAHRFLTDDTRAGSLPELNSSKEVTDAPLICLAASRGFKLATLDESLCRKPWSPGIAENPL